jgi:hypothetical protein
VEDGFPIELGMTFGFFSFSTFNFQLVEEHTPKSPLDRWDLRREDGSFTSFRMTLFFFAFKIQNSKFKIV